jgi:uncharacterized C2H2 Zn-finger protein
MKNTIQKLQKKKLTCPHCDQTFNRSQGLAGHIRYKHAETLPSKTAQPKAKKEKKKGSRVSMSESFLAAQSAAVPVAVPSTGAHEHLKTALEAVTQRNRHIDEELVRMEALQAEKETIRKQIDALNLAMQAFDVGITGLSRDSNLGISVGKSQELEKLPPTVTLTEKPAGGNSAPPRHTPSDPRLKEESRLKVIERIINDLGKRPTTRQMAKLLAREGFAVSHVQVFKDYRTLKSRT